MNCLVYPIVDIPKSATTFHSEMTIWVTCCYPEEIFMYHVMTYVV